MPIIDLRRGDDLSLRATFTTEINMPANLTGWTLEASLRFPDCGTTTPITTEWIDAAGGVASVLYSDADTLSLEVGDYELRVRAISPLGEATSAPAVTIRVTD